ncbi:MAG: LytTR family DNA-binding domain-containing protein [Spiribacter sp.]|nr:LytTR family DNA-binding domain-containing protein [Spiribacter sp.]MDR9489376.1 LytTR family DNA-binding domain-containing protein [Spiribacter sp.]
MKILIACQRPALRHRLARLSATSPGCAVSAVLEAADAAMARQQRDPADVVVIGVSNEADLAQAARLSNLASAPALVLACSLEDPLMPQLEASGVDYVLEHVQPERMRTALHRARPLNAVQAAALQAPGEDGRRRHILCRRRAGLGLIPVDDVRYFMADQKYITVEHDDGEDLIEESLYRLEAEFGPRFLRIHRSALVARDALRGIERDEQGRTHVLVDGSSQRLPVSRRRLPGVRRWLKDAASAG